MLKRFYVALGGTGSYIARCKRTSNFHVHDLLTISEIYCDHEEYATAEGWLGKISQDNRAVAAERAAFLASPSADSFATFEARCGRDAAAVLEREFLAKICEAAAPSVAWHRGSASHAR